MGENGPSCIIREISEELNVLVDPGAHIKRVKHEYTHFSITMDAYRCKYRSGQTKALGCADFRWVYPYEIQQFTFPSASHKLFDNIVDMGTE